MMNELIQSMVAKVGISEEQAQGSVGMVMEFVKSKIPASMHGMLDGIAGGEEGGEGEESGGGVADMAKNALGGILGGKE